MAGATSRRIEAVSQRRTTAAAERCRSSAPSSSKSAATMDVADSVKSCAIGRHVAVPDKTSRNGTDATNERTAPYIGFVHAMPRAEIVNTAISRKM